jgi:integrase
LPDGATRHYQFRSVRQVLRAAVADEILSRDPSQGIPNPVPKPAELHPFHNWAELETLAQELDPRYRAIPIFAAGTGLRPEEWIALEWKDIDLDAGIVHVRRVYTKGRLKEHGKTSRSRRRVPLRQKAHEALAERNAPAEGLVFPGATGGHLNLHNWREREWEPAVKASGQRKRTPYTLRHTFASFNIAAGMSLFHLAKIMGTSVRLLDQTYGHLLPESDEQLRALMDSWDALSRGRKWQTYRSRNPGVGIGRGGSNPPSPRAQTMGTIWSFGRIWKKP